MSAIIADEYRYSNPKMIILYNCICLPMHVYCDHLTFEKLNYLDRIVRTYTCVIKFIYMSTLYVAKGPYLIVFMHTCMYSIFYLNEIVPLMVHAMMLVWLVVVASSKNSPASE